MDLELTEVQRNGAIAILGGSFDPIHGGHLGMAKTAMEALALNGVIFVPCHVSPFKDGTVASGEERWEMLQLAIEGNALDGALVSRYEIDKGGPSYSWETVRHFSEQYPEVSWHWILGTDQWETIEKWAEPEFLKEHLNFIVLTREGQEVKPREGWRFHAVPFQHPASSTAIRNDFAAHEKWLSPQVITYCREHHLYGA